MGRKKFTKEFKVEAVALAEKIGMTAAARELDIGDSSLYRWRDALAKDGADAFPGNGKLKPLDEENRQLRLENRRLREEKEILRKAALFFAKEDRK